MRYLQALPLLFLILSVAPAQEGSVRKITVEEAVRIAMDRNSDLQTARLEVDRADARVQEAWGYALPSISLSGRYTRTLKKPVFFLPDFSDLSSGRTVPVSIGSNHSVEGGLTASQILFNGTVFVGVGAASIYSEVSRDMFTSKQLETVTSVKRAFYGALLAREARDLAHSSMTNAEDNLKNVRLLRQQGVLSEFDELRASVALENLRPNVIQAETGYEISLENLKGTVGLNPSDIVEPAGAMEFFPVDDSLISAAHRIVLETNPGYIALQKSIDVNEAFVMAERSNYLPTISAFGNYQYQYAKNTIDISLHDFIASSQVGLQFSMSLFQGFQTNAKVQQAQVDVLQSQERLVNTERALKTGLTSVIGNLQAARKRIEAQERTVEQATRSHSIVTTRFLSGSATQLEVNDAQLALTQAKVNRIQALYDYAVSSAELDQLLGRLPAYIQHNERD